MDVYDVIRKRVLCYNGGDAQGGGEKIRVKIERYRRESKKGWRIRIIPAKIWEEKWAEWAGFPFNEFVIKKRVRKKFNASRACAWHNENWDEPAIMLVAWFSRDPWSREEAEEIKSFLEEWIEEERRLVVSLDRLAQYCFLKKGDIYELTDEERKKIKKVAEILLED